MPDASAKEASASKLLATVRLKLTEAMLYTTTSLVSRTLLLPSDVVTV
jgi:hypothetical protein